MIDQVEDGLLRERMAFGQHSEPPTTLSPSNPVIFCSTAAVSLHTSWPLDSIVFHPSLVLKLVPDSSPVYAVVPVLETLHFGMDWEIGSKVHVPSACVYPGIAQPAVTSKEHIDASPSSFCGYLLSTFTVECLQRLPFLLLYSCSVFNIVHNTQQVPVSPPHPDPLPWKPSCLRPRPILSQPVIHHHPLNQHHPPSRQLFQAG